MAETLRGRGRLSAMDLLPEEAEEDVAWALGELKERHKPAYLILAEFNERLRIKGIGPISKSAFNRTSMRLSRIGARLEQTREIAAVLAPKMEEAGLDDLTLLVSETIKTLAFNMLENAGELEANTDTAEMLQMTARALQAAEGARRISADTRKKIEKELVTKAEQVIDTVAKEAGLSVDRVAQIRRDVLGVRPPAGPVPNG